MDTTAQEEAGARMTEWAERLAREVAPDEVDVAAAMTEAFAQGGTARRELFARAGPTPGGFGVGEVVAVIPWLLQAITQGAPLLLSLLASTKLVADFLGCVKAVISLLESKRHDEHPAAVSSAPLRRVIDVMEQQLRRAGLSEERVQRITFGTLKVLLEEPREGSEFIHEVAKEG